MRHDGRFHDSNCKRFIVIQYPHTTTPLLISSPHYRCSFLSPKSVFSWLHIMTPFTAVFHYRRLFASLESGGIGGGVDCTYIFCHIRTIFDRSHHPSRLLIVDSMIELFIRTLIFSLYRPWTWPKTTLLIITRPIYWRRFSDLRTLPIIRHCLY